MAKRRTSTRDALGAMSDADALAARIESARQQPARPQASPPAPPDPLVQVSIRLPKSIADRLQVEAFTRKQANTHPATIQAIAADAIAAWLRENAG